MCWRQVDRYYMVNDFSQTVCKTFTGDRVVYSAWHPVGRSFELLDCFSGDGALERAKAACRERRESDGR